MTQRARRFEGQITKSVELDYLLYLPDGCDANDGVKWPLILFLHGAGERGTDINLVKKHGVAKIVEDKRDFPFIVVSPQCSDSTYWDEETDSLIGLIEEIQGKYPIDEKRIYLTGLSMGGYGTWALAIHRPDLFAAAAPICGGGRKSLVHRMKDVPTWAFHGEQDDVVPISESQDMVEALRTAGGDVRFTVYPDADHDSWTKTYENPELYTWLLSHRKA